MRPDRIGRRRGFTLLEALVATFVVAILLVPVLRSVVASANAGRVADRQLAARLVLNRLLAALPMAGGKFIPNASGTDGPFTWTVAVTPGTVAKGASFVPYRVDASVSGDGGAPVSFETVRLGPP